MFNYDQPAQSEEVIRKNEESNEELIESLLKFSDDLISTWPQIDKSTGNLNYYIAGSLAPILLSQVDSFTELDSEKFPQVQESTFRAISSKAKTLLISFIRKIGDLDYVSLNNSTSHPKSESKIKLFCDPVEVYGSNEVARIFIHEHDFYISRPDNLYAYKVLNLIENYPYNPEKFNRDFPILHQAFLEIYSKQELLNKTNQILNEFEADMNKFSRVSHRSISYNLPPFLPKYIQKVFNHPDCTPDLKQLLLELEIDRL